MHPLGYIGMKSSALNLTKIKYLFLSLAALLSAVVGSRADLLVYEGFDYSLADGAPIHGVDTNAMGLSGSYSTAVSGTGATALFTQTGLEFGPDFPAGSGGALRVSTGVAASNSSVRVSVPLEAGSPAGTVWNSFLGRVESRVESRNDLALLGRVSEDEAGTAAGRRFINAIDSSANLAPGTGYGSTQSGGTPNQALNVGETYLFLSKFTGVGTSLSAGNVGEARQWVLNEAGFAAWVDEGALESQLDAYAIRMASDSVSSGTIVFADGLFQQFAAFGPSNNNIAGIIDEVRWGTSLGSVSVEIEPEQGSVFSMRGIPTGAPPPAAGMTLPWFDGFESDAAGDFISGTRDWLIDAGTAVVIADGTPPEGANFLNLRGVDSVIKKTVGVHTGTVPLWFDFFVVPRLNRTGSDPAVAGQDLAFYFAADGRLRAFDGDGAGGGRWRTLDLPPFALQSWVRISLRIDFVQGQWEIWLNGTRLEENLGMRSAVSGLESFAITGGVQLDAAGVAFEAPNGLRFDWSKVPELYPGIQHHRAVLNNPRLILLNVVRVDSHDPDIRFSVTPRDQLWGNAMPKFPDFTVRTRKETPFDFFASEQARGRKILAAVNASPFRPFNEVSPETGELGRVQPYADRLGLTISHGEVVDFANGRPSIVVEKDWRVRMQASPPETDISNILHAVSGFFFILENGARSSGGASGFRARTGIGLCWQGRFVYLFTVDERSRVSDGVETPELADLMLHYGAWTAINMDGGGSTSMIVRNPETDAPESPGAWGTDSRSVGTNFGVYRIETPEEIPMADWLAARGVPEVERLPLVDSAGDGVPNLLKYLFNIHPVRGASLDDAFALPTMNVYADPEDGQRLGLVFRLNRHASDAALFAERSLDLLPGSWNGTGILIEGIGTDPATNDGLFRASILIDEDREFLRLRGEVLQP